MHEEWSLQCKGEEAGFTRRMELRRVEAMKRKSVFPLAIVSADVLDQDRLAGFIFRDSEAHCGALGHQFAEVRVAAHAAAQLWHCGFRGGTHLCSQGRAGFQIIDQYRAIDGKTFIQKVGIDCARLSFITFFQPPAAGFYSD